MNKISVINNVLNTACVVIGLFLTINIIVSDHGAASLPHLLDVLSVTVTIGIVSSIMSAMLAEEKWKRLERLNLLLKGGLMLVQVIAVLTLISSGRVNAVCVLIVLVALLLFLHGVVTESA